MERAGVLNVLYTLYILWKRDVCFWMMCHAALLTKWLNGAVYCSIREGHSSLTTFARSCHRPQTGAPRLRLIELSLFLPCEPSCVSFNQGSNIAWFLLCVNPNVHFQIVPVAFATMTAMLWFLPCVDPSGIFQSPTLIECFPTIGAVIWFLPCVAPHVHCKFIV